jgi:hypothetical protein
MGGPQTRPFFMERKMKAFFLMLLFIGSLVLIGYWINSTYDDAPYPVISVKP